MPGHLCRKISGAIEAYLMDPESERIYVKPLTAGSEYFRLRVAGWRVIFTDDGVTMAVIHISPSGSDHLSSEIRWTGKSSPRPQENDL